MFNNAKPKRKFEDLKPFTEHSHFELLSNHIYQLLLNSTQTTPEDFPQREEINDFLKILTDTEDKADLFEICMTYMIKLFESKNLTNSTSSPSKPARGGTTRGSNVSSSPAVTQRGTRSSNYNSTGTGTGASSRRKNSSQIKKGETDDDYTSNRRGSALDSSILSDKKPINTRSRAAESTNKNLQSTTGNRDYNRNSKIASSRVSAIKEETAASPESSPISPAPLAVTLHDPNYISNLKVLSETPPKYARNATSFIDTRPKKVVNSDFSKAKGTFSIPIQTFQNYAEGFLRPLTEGDLKILEPKELDTSLFEIPELGKHYKKVWEEEDRDFQAGSDQDDESPSANNSNPIDNPTFLTERLFSALIPVFPNKDDEDLSQSGSESYSSSDEDLDPKELSKKLQSFKPNPSKFENRLRSELAAAGMIEEGAKPEPQFDEITERLIKLQNQLRELHDYNNLKKKRLAKVAQEHLAYQEYSKVMDNFDTKLEASYAKRQSANKNRRKKNSNQVRSLPEGASQTLDLRNRFINLVGKVFENKMINLPDKSIYEGIPIPPSLAELFKGQNDEILEKDNE